MKFIIILITALSLIGCNDIIEINISNVTPTVLLPQMNDSVAENPVHFKWEKVEGASKYRLEVVSSSFDNINQFIVDTIIQNTEFFYALDTNQYEMRVTALNNAYTSKKSTPIKFIVGIEPTYNPNLVSLLYPLNSQYLNSTFNQIFKWSSLPNTISYEFSLRKGNNFITDSIIYNSIILNNSLPTSQLDLSQQFNLQDGFYTWGVKANTTTGETSYYSFKFTIDTQIPPTPYNILPTSNSTILFGDINFTWNYTNDSGNAQTTITSELIISTDSLFTNVLQTINTNNKNSTVNLPVGTFYWKVKNHDLSGNQSFYSNPFKLILY